ncbi:MAG: hypothetical protein HON94_08835 [Methylococcales bacterium]|nr:hypothetical protein [Methylococcales bacterium]MBT7408891.1 hypothetical protein [Methylococcales bacterium]
MKTFSILFFCYLTFFSAHSLAANNDDFLTAFTSYKALHGEIDGGGSISNQVSNQFIQKYQDAHIKVYGAIFERVRLEVGGWKQFFSNQLNSNDNLKAYVASQFQITVPYKWLPAVALRVNVERDQSSQIRLADGNSTLIQINSINSQLNQIGLIGSWNVSRFGLLSISAFNEEITNNSSDNGVGYTSTVKQLGLNYQWFNNKWRFRFSFRKKDFDNSLDAQLTTLSRLPIKENKLIAVEIGYKLFSNVGLFIRLQKNDHLLLEKAPAMYNIHTANDFNQKINMFSFGIQSGF